MRYLHGGTVALTASMRRRLARRAGCDPHRSEAGIAGRSSFCCLHPLGEAAEEFIDPGQTEQLEHPHSSPLQAL